MAHNIFFDYFGETYDLLDENWRNREEYVYLGMGLQRGMCHILKHKDGTTSFGCYEECAFCEADSTFYRSLKEILYHFQKCGGAGVKAAQKTLIEKWKNNKDAWDNPIGENIKGE